MHRLKGFSWKYIPKWLSMRLTEWNCTDEHTHLHNYFALSNTKKYWKIAVQIIASYTAKITKRNTEKLENFREKHCKLHTTEITIKIKWNYSANIHFSCSGRWLWLLVVVLIHTYTRNNTEWVEQNVGDRLKAIITQSSKNYSVKRLRITL